LAFHANCMGCALASGSALAACYTDTVIFIASV